MKTKAKTGFKHNPPLIYGTIETAGRMYTDSPQGPGNFHFLRQSNYGEGFKQGTFGDQFALAHGAYTNQGKEGAMDIVKLLRNFWLSGNTSILYTPTLVIVQDMPEVKDGRIVMDEKNLNSRLSKNAKNGVRFSDDGSVRALPYSFKTGWQSSDKIRANLFPVALTGNKDAPEMLEEIINKIGKSVYIYALNKVSEPEIRVPDLCEDDDRLNLFGDGWNGFNDGGRSFGIALVPRQIMVKTYNNLYNKICSLENIMLSHQKARKGKTKKQYVIEFETDLEKNLIKLHLELRNEIYYPQPPKMFIISDPKTRRISKSDFRDRIVHHAILNIMEPLFNISFIFDSYANRKGKGTLKAVQRLDFFIGKVSSNGSQKGWFSNNQIKGYCLKADIKKYFETVNHEVLINILNDKINDRKLIILLKKIVTNFNQQRERERVQQTRKACQ
jgi:hypothetical protein